MFNGLITMVCWHPTYRCVDVIKIGQSYDKTGSDAIDTTTKTSSPCKRNIAVFQHFVARHVIRLDTICVGVDCDEFAC